MVTRNAKLQVDQLYAVGRSIATKLTAANLMNVFDVHVTTRQTSTHTSTNETTTYVRGRLVGGGGACGVGVHSHNGVAVLDDESVYVLGVLHGDALRAVAVAAVRPFITAAGGL